jgi:crossover junction endodeoxyribonuclease RuvC
MITIGVDPGLAGAVGVLRDGAYVAVEDMPTAVKGVGSVKSEVNAAGLILLLKLHIWSSESTSIAIEKVGAMPGQGVSSVFSLGDSYGSARTACAATGVELHQVSPVAWKKHFKLSSDKELSRALAIRLFPGAPLHLKKHDGRAEALLLARWLWEVRYS